MGERGNYTWLKDQGPDNNHKNKNNSACKQNHKERPKRREAFSNPRLRSRSCFGFQISVVSRLSGCFKVVPLTSMGLLELSRTSHRFQGAAVLRPEVWIWILSCDSKVSRFKIKSQRRRVFPWNGRRQPSPSVLSFSSNSPSGTVAAFPRRAFNPFAGLTHFLRSPGTNEPEP